MASSVEDILNMALRRIAFPTPIGFIYEGSNVARVGIEIYGQTRDELLRSFDWDFARQAVGLALTKTAPVGGYGYGTPWTSAYPPPPWVYQYAYPAGCLLLRSVRPTPIIIPVMDPQPNVFTLGDDASGKMILTNLAGAQAVFTGQIVDVTQWNASFTEAIVAALATRFQAALGPTVEADKERMEQEAQATGAAAGRRG